MHHHFTTVHHRIMWFTPKCSEKSLSANQCKIFVNGYNILWYTTRTGHVISDVTCL